MSHNSKTGYAREAQEEYTQRLDVCIYECEMTFGSAVHCELMKPFINSK